MIECIDKKLLPEVPIIYLNLKYLIMFSHMHLPFENNLPSH